MSRSLFVAGTDTEIGKTRIACGLLSGLAGAGLRAVGMKPVAAGTIAGPQGPFNEDVAALAAVSAPGFAPGLVNPYLFDEPVAPHLAAARHGTPIRLEHIEACFRALAARADAVVVEGVGGLRVPLGEGVDAADLAARLALPVVLVVGMRLGCINHALLTAEAIATRGLRLAGWVANAIDPGMALFDENVAAIDRRIGAPLLGVVPRLAEPGPVSVARHLRLPAAA